MTNDRVYTEDVRQAPDSEIVCWCAGVTKGEILRAAAASSHRTLEDVRATTGACQEGRCKETNPRGR